MEIKVEKSKNGLTLIGQLPKEIEDASALEIFALRNGMFLLAVKGAMDNARKEPGAPASQSAVSSEERGVIKKLSAIRFEKRSPPEVDGLLSAAEKKVLSVLLEKKMVNIFHSGKYGKDGVYNISDWVYPLVKDAQAAPAPSANAAPVKATQQPALPLQLAKQGYMILDNEQDARRLSDALPGLVKAGEVFGVRAFDGKYYLVSKEFAGKWEGKVRSSLSQSDKTPESLSSEIGMPPDGCRALLYHLCDIGEVLEKQKGKFASA